MVGRREPEKRGINFTSILPGSKVLLSNGAVVEVVENPRDGYWLLVKYISNPVDASLVGKQDTAFVYDVEKIL